MKDMQPKAQQPMVQTHLDPYSAELGEVYRADLPYFQLQDVRNKLARRGLGFKLSNTLEIVAMAAVPARLDADRTAQPKTRLIAKVNPNHCHTGKATHYEGDDKVRTSLQAKANPPCPECNLNDRVRDGSAAYCCDRCGTSFIP